MMGKKVNLSPVLRESVLPSFKELVSGTGQSSFSMATKQMQCFMQTNC